MDIGNVTGIRIVPGKPTDAGRSHDEGQHQVLFQPAQGLYYDLLATAGILGETYVDVDSAIAKGPEATNGDTLARPQTSPTFRTWCAPAKARCRTWTPC